MSLPRPLKRALILCARVASFLRRDRSRPPHLDESRILVVEANSVGDVLVSGYAIRTLLNHYPDARVDVVSTPVGQPYVQRILGGRGTCYAWDPNRPTALLALAGSLWSNRYDLALNVLPAFRNLLLTHVAGAKHVAGFLDFYTGNRFFAMPHTIRASWSDEVRRYLPGQSLVGKQAEILSLLFSTPEEILLEFRKIPLLRGTKVREICLSFLSLDPLKTMPHDLLEDVVRFLERRWPDHHIYSLVTDAERRSIEADSLIRSHVELRPVGSLDDSLAMISTASLFVGVDSSQIHMAQMTDTPVIGIFSYTPASLALFRTCDVYGVEGLGCATGDPDSPAWPTLDADLEERLLVALGAKGLEPRDR